MSRPVNTPQKCVLHRNGTLFNFSCPLYQSLQNYIQQNAACGLQHIDDHFDQGFGREEHAIVLGDILGKFVQEIFVDADDDVAGLHRACNAFGHDLHVLVPPILYSMGNSYSHLLLLNLLLSPAVFKPFSFASEDIPSCKEAGMHVYRIALFMFFPQYRRVLHISGCCMCI